LSAVAIVRALTAHRKNITILDANDSFGMVGRIGFVSYQNNRPSFVIKFLQNNITVLPDLESRLPVGSSAKIIAGSQTRAGRWLPVVFHRRKSGW